MSPQELAKQLKKDLKGKALAVHYNNWAGTVNVHFLDQEGDSNRLTIEQAVELVAGLITDKRYQLSHTCATDVSAGGQPSKSVTFIMKRN